ncbi:MAG TPA: DUF1707 domain-containing protein [Longimicrobiales bacterium]|nr:DUF1707 domain-containing protein [Longimicrobiales bacterium]
MAKAHRDAAIEALSRGFAHDHLSMDEFEARVERAIGARTEDELAALLSDLPSSAIVPATQRAPVPATIAPPRTRAPDPQHDERRQHIVAIMSGARRVGAWDPSHQVFAYAVCGGAELDFREAALAPGVTTVTAVAIMGGVEIILPPGVAVDVEGFALMGGLDHLHERGASDDPDAPRIRVQGFAMMGGVDVSVRRVGESRREAARRRRAEKRALKKGSS